MSKGVKLTEAQRRALQHVGNGVGRRRGCGWSAPVRRIIRRGLVDVKPHPRLEYRSNYCWMTITAAGRAALKGGE
jgi:hypothetical protein